MIDLKINRRLIMKKWFRRFAVGSLVVFILFVGITFGRLQ